MRFVLASVSPRRAELLASAGFVFDVYPVDVDERVHADESASDYVCRLASEKSRCASERLGQDSARSGSIIVAADTAVVVDGEILGKPQDDRDAARMLQRLSGRSHEVMTGVSVRAGAEELGTLETTTVWFRRLSAADVAWYVRTGEGRDKAGAYAIQGLASRFIPRISGSYSNVVGLPVATVAELLERLQTDARAG